MALIQDNNIDVRNSTNSYLYWGSNDNYTGVAFDNYINNDSKIYALPWIGCDGDEQCLANMSQENQQLYWTHEVTNVAAATGRNVGIPYTSWGKASGVWYGKGDGGYFREGYFCPCHKKWTPIRANDSAYEPPTNVKWVTCNPFKENQREETEIACNGNPVELADGLYSTGCYLSGQLVDCHEWATHPGGGLLWQDAPNDFKQYKAFQALDNNLWYKIPYLPLANFPTWHPVRSWNYKLPVMLGAYFSNNTSNMSVPEFLGCPQQNVQRMFSQFGASGDNTTSGSQDDTWEVGEEEYGTPGELFDGKFYKNGMLAPLFNWSTPVYDEASYIKSAQHAPEQCLWATETNTQSAGSCNQQVALKNANTPVYKANGCYSTGVYDDGYGVTINESLSGIAKLAELTNSNDTIYSTITPVQAIDTKLWYIYGGTNPHVPTSHLQSYWASSFDLEMAPNNTLYGTLVSIAQKAAGAYSNGFFSNGRLCITFSTQEDEWLPFQDRDGWEGRYQAGLVIQSRETE